MNDKELVLAACEKLKASSATQGVMVGFDGFIDEIIHLVSERQSATSFDRIENMMDLSTRIADAAGKSCNIEMVSTQTKLGGNGPILANALVLQGYEVDYVGALGASNIHPVFKDFVQQCRQVISMADPAHTDALEFFDGKIMMGKNGSLDNVSWDSLLAMISRDQLKAALEGVSLIGCVNWTMLPYMNSLLEGFFDVLKEIDDRKILFIDLTDPRKRTAQDIAAVLNVLTSMQDTIDVVLGLNDEESIQVATVLKLEATDDYALRAAMIREKLSLHLVVVHPVKGAAVSFDGGSAWFEGPYTQYPKLTTGAGDNFNAGFCNGLLSGLSPQESLAAGVCTSGFYVRNCRSAKRMELTEFMNAWADADLGEI